MHNIQNMQKMQSMLNKQNMQNMQNMQNVQSMQNMAGITEAFHLIILIQGTRALENVLLDGLDDGITDLTMTLLFRKIDSIWVYV